MRDRLIDRLAVFIAPAILGKGIDSVGELGITGMADAILLHDVEVDWSGPDLFYTARVKDAAVPGTRGPRERKGLMFTGIVEEVGLVCDVRRRAGYQRTALEASRVPADVAIGDSISIDGACHTVVDVGRQGFLVRVHPGDP